MPNKNLLFITADQWRGECLSVLGHPTVKTPHLDALAAEGVLFRNHYAQCTPCGPSRASLYTGMYLQNHRSIQNGVPLDARHTNLALEMRKLGYEPTLVGYTDTTPDPRGYPPHDPVLTTYEGILPGFKRVLAMPSTSNPEPWALWLEERGHPVPENLRDLYYNPIENYPGAATRGKTYAPARYPKEASDSAFVTELARQFIRRPGRKPWWLHLSYLRPHPPYLAPEPYNHMYHPDDVPLCVQASSVEEEGKIHPYLAFLLDKNLNVGSYRAEIYPRDANSLRQLRATYFGLMTEIDDLIGRLVTLLKETGQYDDTVIVFGSDHGDLLGDHYLLGKGAYFDRNVHIPLIIRAPGKNGVPAPGRIVDAFTENIDILPTLLELMGAARPRQCDGTSLVPFLRGQTPDHWRTEVHWEVDFRFFDEYPGVYPDRELNLDPEACVYNVIRDGRYKYVHFAALPPLFFDLQKDPGEQQNLAGDSGYTELVLRYALKMLSWRMVNDERTLTHLMAGPDGLIERPRSRRSGKDG
ncbi:MAG: alkaline phosphatase family protein [Desulfobacterales bacterium]|nr:MAG: alkaline phosphatase family protein [Desulfobacterales bacterium]